MFTRLVSDLADPHPQTQQAPGLAAGPQNRRRAGAEGWLPGHSVCRSGSVLGERCNKGRVKEAKSGPPKILCY